MLATRRNVLAAVAVLPIAACPAPATASIAGSDPEWQRLLAAYNAAEADQLARHAAFMVRENAWEASDMARAPRPVAPQSPPFDKSMPLAAILATTETPEWGSRWAAHEAEVQAWVESRRAGRAVAIGDTEKTWEAADDAAALAFYEVRAYPVTSLSALAEKADAMVARYGTGLEANDALALAADIRRLAGKEA